MFRVIRKFFSTAKNTSEFVRTNTETKDLDSLRKSLIYRSHNLGMLELDIIVGKWAKEHVPSFTEEECKNYASEVLSMETPTLYSVFLGEQKHIEEDSDHYVKLIKQSIGINK